MSRESLRPKSRIWLGLAVAAFSAATPFGLDVVMGSRFELQLGIYGEWLTALAIGLALAEYISEGRRRRADVDAHEKMARVRRLDSIIALRDSLTQLKKGSRRWSEICR
jgi:hypothetical protein